MGVCQSDQTNVASQQVEFTAEEIAYTYSMFFDAIVTAAKEMLELEYVTRQQLTPPSDAIVLGLCAVSALNIVAAQAPSQIGLKVGTHDVTKTSIPSYFKDVMNYMIDLKDRLGKATTGKDTVELNKVKQQLLYTPTDTPVKSWGSSLQRYEGVVFTANAVSRFISHLPEYKARKDDVIQRIDKMARESSDAVFKFVPVRGNLADDDTDSDDDGSPGGHLAQRVSASGTNNAATPQNNEEGDTTVMLIKKGISPRQNQQHPHPSPHNARQQQLLQQRIIQGHELRPQQIDDGLIVDDFEE